MILSFKPQFVPAIVAGVKIHTIRVDAPNRWAPSKRIHFATGVRTSNYQQFYEDECRSVQSVALDPEYKVAVVDRKVLSDKRLELLAKNDGFASVEDFWKWFDKPFTGKIIHWTNLKY